MAKSQQGILAPAPSVARHLFFVTTSREGVALSLRALRDIADGDAAVVGLGQSLVRALGREVPELGVFPSYAGAGFEVPSTSAALWCWLRGEDRGEVLHRSRQLEHAVAPGLSLTQAIDAFRYKSGLDLTGYEDGTENPRGDAAAEVALVGGQGPGLDGASFAAVQQWVHDLDRFVAMTPEEQDNTIGRRQHGNEEIDEAPPSAHVKRTAQESFEPAAFVLRRSMPWADEKHAGLVFVAFGKSFDAFEAQLRRMTGAEDGIVDALFRFTRPVTGGYYWCPPMRDGLLDLRAIGL
ncbi:MAG: Dyp-type peroxidase [Candidatus Rokubacteria bacterium]|nr:Dyp-type peroxidase [Candidatus Rokubacteria bacterium]